MADTWTFSEWSIGEADPKAFLSAFREFADAATNFGGAHEGMIFQDVDDQSHFVVVRRWAGPEAVEEWADEQMNHAGELSSLAPDGGRGAVMVKVADLAAPGDGSEGPGS